jgi:hypothetical protein
MPGRAHGGDNISAARKILSTLPGVESDGGSSSDLDALSDSGEDDPDLVSKPSCRPAGPGHRDGAAHAPQEMPRTAALNSPGSGPISPALHQRGSQRKHTKERGELLPRENAPRSSNVYGERASGSKQANAPEPDQTSMGSAGERNSAKLKIAKWKQDAIQEGMRLVEVRSWLQFATPCRKLLRLRQNTKRPALVSANFARCVSDRKSGNTARICNTSLLDGLNF